MPRFAAADQLLGIIQLDFCAGSPFDLLITAIFLRDAVARALLPRPRPPAPSHRARRRARRREPSVKSVDTRNRFVSRATTVLGVIAGTLTATAVWAADAAPPAIDTGDTAWVLTSAALVLMMTLP